MLLYSQETHLNQKAKSYALNNSELASAIKQVLFAYRNYMIDNIPQESSDKDTNIFLRKISKEKTAAFAKICRNTIYKLGRTLDLSDYDISLIAYGIDLLEVSKEEGKYFRAVMPEEFQKLYAQGKTAVSKEILFFVDDFVKDMIDDDYEYIVDFVDGKAYDENNILIAKASYKYNATKAKIVFENGRYYAQTEKGVELSPVGDEVLVRIENISKDTIDKINTDSLEVNYTPKSPNNHNVLFEEEYNNINVYGSLGYKNILSLCYRLMLLDNKKLITMAKNKQFEHINTLLNDYERVNRYSLQNILKINKIECLNANSEFESLYAIISM